MHIVINLSSHGTKTLIFSFSLFFLRFHILCLRFFHFYQMKTLDEPTLSGSINKGRQIIYTEPATGTLKNKNKTFGLFLQGFLYVYWQFVGCICLEFSEDAYRPSGPSDRSKSQFLQHEGTRSISTSLWMGCWSVVGLLPALSSLVPIFTPGLRESL